MITLDTGRKIVGFGLKGIGIFWSIFDRFLCGSLCGDTCSVAKSESCSFLFLFIGIIFIICGYALIVMKEPKKEKLKRKIKDAWKIINKK